MKCSILRRTSEDFLESLIRCDLRRILFTLCLFYCISSAAPVCSLNTGQNAVYWWIAENKAPGKIEKEKIRLCIFLASFNNKSLLQK